jgi:hypothetical protein
MRASTLYQALHNPWADESQALHIDLEAGGCDHMVCFDRERRPVSAGKSDPGPVVAHVGADNVGS